MSKYTLNLLQDDLLPKKPRWSFDKTVQLWGVSALLMLVWFVWSDNKHNELSELANQLSEQEAQLEDQKNSLEKALANHKADAKLVDKLKNAELVLKHKNTLNQLLTSSSSTHAKGFSQAMTELSERHHRDISIQQVKLADDSIYLAGVARAPDSVPTWLTAFEHTTFLSGHHFGHFALRENEQGITEFTVSSQVDGEEAK